MSGFRDCKVVLLGQESSGKSCLVDRFVQGKFEGNARIATVGASYAAKKTKTRCGDVVVNLWDTAGAERFDSLSRLYYSGAEAAIICVDPTNITSFNKAQYWAKELKQHQPACKCYIALCKCDLLEQPPKELPPPVSAPQQKTTPRASNALGEEAELASNTDSVAQPVSPPQKECSALDEQKGMGDAMICDPSPCKEASANGLHRKDCVSASPNAVAQAGREFCSPPEAWNGSQACPRSRSSGEARQPCHQKEIRQRSRYPNAACTGGSPQSPLKRKQVSDAQIQAVKKSLNAKVSATSALTGQGVQELFQMIAEDAAELSCQHPTEPDSSDTVPLESLQCSQGSREWNSQVVDPRVGSRQGSQAGRAHGTALQRRKAGKSAGGCCM